MTSEYSLQNVGPHGNGPQYFDRGEPIRPGTPLHSPQRGEQGTSTFSGGAIKRKQKKTGQIRRRTGGMARLPSPF